MKTFLLFLAVAVVVVLSEHCDDSLTTCMGTLCNTTTHQLACVEHQCTCKLKPKACSLYADCSGVSAHNCDGDESIHCVDQACVCHKDGHHQNHGHGN